jgi:cullin-associated NEDD8-dissociated protein 1
LFFQASSEKEDILRRQIALNVLGEVGKETNLCDKGNILAEVQKIVNNKSNSDVIRTAASIALGGIAIGNLEKVLPQVIVAISNASDGQYLMLNSLKQIIEHSS